MFAAELTKRIERVYSTKFGENVAEQVELLKGKCIEAADNGLDVAALAISISRGVYHVSQFEAIGRMGGIITISCFPLRRPHL